MDILSALLLGSLYCVVLWDLMVTWWVNIFWGQSSHIDLNIHCWTSAYSAWPPFSKQQEYFLSALWARWSFYCLEILGWFGYHPICSQNSWCVSPRGFDSFSPGKCYFITFFIYLSKYDAWRIKNFKTIGCPLDRDTSSGCHIEVLPPPSPHFAAFT